MIVDLKRRICHCVEPARRLFAERRGNATVMAAFAVLPMMAGAGLATDAGRSLMVKNRMEKALDSAGLAAGRVLFSGNAAVDARSYFDANYPAGYMGSEITGFTFSVDDNEEFITVTAAADVPMAFMSMFGSQTVQVSARSVIQRENRGAEVALVMDNTGSMRHPAGKMDAMKAAGQELVDILFGPVEQHENLWVSVVPYTATVNIGPEHWDWLSAGDRYHDEPSPFEPTVWKGCVEARPAPYDETDDPPAAQRFTTFLYPANEIDNDWPEVKDANDEQNAGTGPNLGCGPAITPLSNTKTTVSDAIAEMLPWHRGGTTSNLGLVWGWRTLSPRWRALWSGPGSETPESLPLDYDDPRMDKVAIVLTDGVNQFFDYEGDDAPMGSDYTAYGRLNEFMPSAGDVDDVVPILDDKFGRTCEAMKDAGIQIYTITFGSKAGSSDLRALYRGCASDESMYYHAPDNDTLRDTFRSIGDKLSNLRIVE